MNGVRQFLIVVVTLGLGTGLAVQPLFSNPLYTDGVLHFHRLVQLERAVRHGIIYPRWLPDLGWGFGFPVFNYYAPLSYYLLLPFRWLGFPAQTVILIGLGKALWALSVAMYLWGRDLFGERAGIVAAFAAVYAPCVLNEVYQRVSLPCIWGLVWLALTGWAVRRTAAQGGVLFYAVAVLSSAALLLTHNLTALMGIPLLSVYALCLGWLYGFHTALRSLLAFALGAGIASFFWIPMILEGSYVKLYQLYLPPFFNYHIHFLSLKELLAPPQPVDPAQANFSVPFSLGWSQVALGLVGWASSGAQRSREARLHSWILSLTIIGLSVMALPITLPLWDRIPLLRFIQFPWRFVGPATLVLALMAGAGAEYLLGKTRWGIPVIVAGMMIFAITWLFPLPRPFQADPSPPDQIRFEIQTGALGATSAGEYLPKWVHELPNPEMLLPLYEQAAPDYVIPRLDLTSLSSKDVVLEASYGLTEARLVVESENGFRLRFLWYFFPGWHAWLDGHPVPPVPDGPHGLLALDVPPGRHEVYVIFGDTPIRKCAWLLSIASGVLFILTTLRIRRTGPERFGTAGPIAGSLQPLLICALLAGALGVTKTVYLDRFYNPLRRTLFNGQQVQSVDIPLNVNFGNQLILMGCDLPARTVNADRSLEVILYWRIVSPLDKDYSAGLHLVDERGILYGQQDNMHPGDCPTSHLRPDQYVRDVHRLTPWEGTPPGRYTLLVMVYNRDGHRLDLRDEAGNSLGTTVHQLARVEVLPPAHFPPVDRLPIQERLDAGMGSALRLVGIGHLPDSIEVGQSFHLNLFWQAVRKPETVYQARLHIYDQDGTLITGSIWLPGRADYPTTHWKSGEIVRDVQSIFVPVALPVNPEIPVPAGTGKLHLDLLDEKGLPISEGVDLGNLTISVPERTFIPPSASPLQGFHLGEMATATGYDLAPSTLRAGNTLTLTIYWQANMFIERSYTVFVHLVGPDGRIYAQQDLPPAGGTRPTTGWFPGEFIRDMYLLTVDPLAPSGEYRIAVGWYDPTTGQRVPVLRPDGSPEGDHFLLPEIIEVK